MPGRSTSHARSPPPPDDRNDADGSAGEHPPKRRRKRAVLVCKRCKHLKLRCDQQRPCGACARGGLEEECEYVRWGWPEQVGPEPPRGDPVTPQVQSAPASNGYTTHRGRSAEEARLARRVAELEAKLEATIAEVKHQSGGGGPSQLPVLPTGDSPIRGLVALLPPVEQCRGLVAEFFKYDIMFRFVHTTVFAQRAERVLERLGTVGSEDAPLLAMVAGAMLIAVNLTPPTDPAAEAATARRAESLRAAMEGLLDLCESHGRALVDLDYVHAQLFAVGTHTVGRSSTPDKTFLATGRAYHAALIAGIHRDVPGESVFMREMRRRVWWHIVILKNLFQDRLRTGGPFPDPMDVPRPTVVADALLLPPDWDTQPPLTSAITVAAAAVAGNETHPEWAYIDGKMDFVQLLMRRKEIMAREGPLFGRLNEAIRLFTDKIAQSTRSPHRGVTHTDPLSLSPRPPPPAPGSPPWLYMQACVMEISYEDAVCNLLRPHFSSPEPTEPSGSLGAWALARAVESAHRVLALIQAMTMYVLFVWIDAPSLALWTYGMKAFTAGMIMAYSLLSDNGSGTSDKAREQAAALDAAIGALRSTIHTAGSSCTNTQALQTLEHLRAVVRSRSETAAGAEGGVAVAGDVVVDPYTGVAVPLPFAFPDWTHMTLGLPDEWSEWEALFRDLFQG